MCVRPTSRRWYCGDFLSEGGVKSKTLSLKAAQRNLGFGTQQSPRAIIPMNGATSGDPHSLPKTWPGGAMWWLNYAQIDEMRKQCEQNARQFGIPDVEG